MYLKLIIVIKKKTYKINYNKINNLEYYKMSFVIMVKIYCPLFIDGFDVCPPTSSTRFARVANVGGRHQFFSMQFFSYFRPSCKKNSISTFCPYNVIYYFYFSVYLLVTRQKLFYLTLCWSRPYFFYILIFFFYNTSKKSFEKISNLPYIISKIFVWKIL